MSPTQSDFIASHDYQQVFSPVVRAYLNQPEPDNFSYPEEFIEALNIYKHSTMEERQSRHFAGWNHREDPFDVVDSWPTEPLDDEQIRQAQTQLDQILKIESDHKTLQIRVAPNGCAICNVVRQSHSLEWGKGLGFHSYVQPSNQQRLARMKANRANR